MLGAGGVTRPPVFGPAGVAGAALAIFGAVVALWCIFTFVFVGRGTPAPFDPPRRLVVRGPYRFVRNPMYVGSGLALAGAAIVYRSLPLLGYLLFLWAAVHALVIWYEEPNLTRLFGADYDAYRRNVSRWLPQPPRHL